MKKRIIAVLLVISFLSSMMVPSSLANTQIQLDSVTVDEVYYVEGEDSVTGEKIIRPTMDVSWKAPLDWAQDQGSTQVHSPEYYDVTVSNITRGTSNVLRINKSSQEFTDNAIALHEKLKLETGSLYSIEVRPFHMHSMTDGSGLVLAPSSGIPAYAYAITDLNVKFVTTETSIQVIWDDLGSEDFTYRMVYAIGDYTTKSKQEIMNNKQGEIVGLTSDSDGVTRYYDPVEKRNKLTYTIEEGIYPGQVYSVMVEPTVDYFNGKGVMRNRNYPVIRSCSTNVRLNLYEEGDYLRLEWDIPGSFKVGQNRDEYALVEATLVQNRGGQSSNVVIFDGDAAVIGYYKVPKPSRETQYSIKFVYKAVMDQSKPIIEPISNVVTYVPSELQITPTKPVVPRLFSKQILTGLQNSNLTTEQIRQMLTTYYFVPGYTYLGNLNDIPNMSVTYQVKTDNSINLVWGAFKRIDVDPTSATYNQYIYDNNVYYDIWVTDTLEALAYAPKIVDDQRYGSGTTNNNIMSGNTIVGYNQGLSTYYRDEVGAKEDIIPDKLYYIKLVAKKKTASGELVSEPTILALYFDYEGDSYAPPVITKPPLEIKKEKTTDKGISIIWEEEWTEIIGQGVAEDDPLYGWVHEVWVTDDGIVHLEKVQDSTYFPIYEGIEVVNEFKAYLAELGIPTVIQSRTVDLGEDGFGVSDIRYKFLRIPYSTVQAAIDQGKLSDPAYDFTDYYNAMIAADKDGTSPLAWKDITPIQDPDNAQKILYREEGLLPNTTYMFLIYPYRINMMGEVLYAHYPTPIVGTTNPVPVVIHPDPTVPSLYVSDTTDMSITVAWKYNWDFEYELVYSLFEDVTKAEPIDIDVPSSTQDPAYPKNGEFYEVKLDDLFPNTVYYFWLRAKQPANNKVSQWSNPVIGQTRDVTNPFPPKGFGIASLESMKTYKYTASVTDDYIAVEWILDPDDVAMENGRDVNKHVVYVVELADNPQFIDPVYIESAGGEEDIVPENVTILRKNLLIVNDLVANRPYYIRVKSRIIVTGKEEGQLIVKDSLTYSPAIRVVTVASEDEYDGVIDPDTTVLPTSDYEITYDSATGTLNYRFRDDGVGADGLPDNNVDQRLIDSLITQNIFTYTIDVGAYQNKTVKKRVIDIPYSIMEAFTTYQVGIHIAAGDIQVDLPYGVLQSAINAQVKQYGVDPSVRIQIDSLGDAYLATQRIDPGLVCVAGAQAVSMMVSSSKLNQPVQYTDKDLTINMKVNNRYEAFRVQRVGTVRDFKNNWVDLQTSYNNDTGLITFKTSKVGTYSGYMIKTNTDKITSDKGHWSEAARKTITSAYLLKGLEPYNPNANVKEAELIQVLYGMLAGNRSIDLDGYIPNNMVGALNYSGIKNNASQTKTQVTREEAISMLTRAYELMHNEIIIPNSTVTKAINGNKNISTAYKTLMAKATTVGLVSDINKARPKDPIKYSELFTLWSRIYNANR